MHVFVVPLLSYCSTKTKLHKEMEWKGCLRWYRKAKLIQLPGTSTEHKCFPLFWIPLLFLDAAGNEDVEMASQNPGIVQLQVEAPAWTGAWLYVILGVQEGAHIDLTLIFRGDGNSASWLKCNSLLWFSLQLSLIKDPPWSVLLAAEEYVVQSSKCVCTSWMNRPWDPDVFGADSESSKWIESGRVCFCLLQRHNH